MQRSNAQHPCWQHLDTMLPTKTMAHVSSQQHVVVEGKCREIHEAEVKVSAISVSTLAAASIKLSWPESLSAYWGNLTCAISQI